MNKKFALVMAFMLLAIIASAQVRKLSFNAASSFLNPSVVAEPQRATVKSSFALEATISPVTFLYGRAIKISYQIPATHAIEWAIIRSRASNILNSDAAFLMNENPTLFNSIQSLAYNDFVPMSSYGRINVKLDFRYNRTNPYDAEQFAPMIKGTVITTKTLIIK